MLKIKLEEKLWPLLSNAVFLKPFQASDVLLNKGLEDNYY